MSSKWVLAGVAMAGVLYPPDFAALTRWYGPDRVSALTALTLVAGLASTVFALLTAWLDTMEQLLRPGGPLRDTGEGSRCDQQHLSASHQSQLISSATDVT